MTSDMTHGSIWKKLIAFAIPLLLASLVQQLYSAVDLIFVGQFLGKSVSSAVGAGSLLISCMIGFFGGMSVGSGVVAAQAYGAGDKATVRKAAHNAMAVSLAGGLLLAVAGYMLAPCYLRLTKTPDVLLNVARIYLRIYFLSFPAVAAYNMGAGVLRAIGDARTPLLAQLFGGILHILMDAIFIVWLRAGVGGAAWATLFSQSAAAAIVVLRMTHFNSELALRFVEIRFHADIFRQVLRLGLPAGTQSLLISLSNVMVQYQINMLDVDVIAAFTAYFKIELIIYLPIVALGQALMTLTGQNAGAGDRSRVRAGTRVCVLVGIGMTAALSAVTLAFGEPLFCMFNREPEVVSLGLRIIKISFPFYFFYVILQVLGDTLRGLGNTRIPMLIVMANICIVRTALLFVLVPQNPDIGTVAAVYPITWALTALCMAAYYFHYLRKSRYSGKEPLLNIE